MRRFFTVLLFCTVFPALAFCRGAGEKVREANESYSKGDYASALSRYAEAQVDMPDSPQLQFNMAAALYQQGKCAEAAEILQRLIAAKDKDLAARASYNLGNSNFRLGKLDEALKLYKQVIEMAPDDQDAKFNFELTRKLLAQPPPEHEKGEGQGGEGKGSNQQNQPASTSARTPAPQPEQRAGEEQQNKPANAQPSGTASPSAAPSPSGAPASSAAEQGKLTEAQLKQLLDYLAGKEAAFKQPPKRFGNYPKPERDW